MQVAHQITAPYRFNFLLWVLIPLVLCRSSDRSVLYTLNVFLYSVLTIYILYSELSILRENEEVAASRLIYSWWRFLPSFACFSLAPIPASPNLLGVYYIHIIQRVEQIRKEDSFTAAGASCLYFSLAPLPTSPNLQSF